MNAASILLCLAIIFVQDGYGLLCYHCHQTTKECNNGYLNDNNQKNCSENRCAVMKYETPMPGRKVLATIRDCAAYTENELIQRVSAEVKTPPRIIIFQECDTPLCNVSTKQHPSTTRVKIVILFLLCLLR